jgi:hypothetical protein
MKRVDLREYEGKRLLVIDLTGADLEEIVRVIAEAKGIIRTQPPKSLLTLTEVARAQVSPAVTRVMKEFVRHNEPFVRAAAVVGLSPVMRALYLAVTTFSGRTIPVFATDDKALEWLRAQ